METNPHMMPRMTNNAYFKPGSKIQAYLSKYDTVYKGSRKTDSDWIATRLAHHFHRKNMFHGRNVTLFILDEEAAEAMGSHTIHKAQIATAVEAQMTPTEDTKIISTLDDNLRNLPTDLYSLKREHLGPTATPVIALGDERKTDTNLKVTQDIKDYVGEKQLALQPGDFTTADILTACVERQLHQEEAEMPTDPNNRDIWILCNHPLGPILNQLAIHKDQLRGALTRILEPPLNPVSSDDSSSEDNTNLSTETQHPASPEGAKKQRSGKKTNSLKAKAAKVLRGVHDRTSLDNAKTTPSKLSSQQKEAETGLSTQTRTRLEELPTEEDTCGSKITRTTTRPENTPLPEDDSAPLLMKTDLARSDTSTTEDMSEGSQ